MSHTVAAYVIYLVIAVPLAIWVARTLHRNGRVFLIEVFQGRTELADSVNHLLVVGFYLLNLGYVSLFLRTGGEIFTVRAVLELVTWKLGIVLLALGGMHFVNLIVLGLIHRRRRYEVIDLTLADPTAPSR